MTKEDILQFVSDAFSTVEAHDLVVTNIKLGIDVYDMLRDKSEINEKMIDGKKIKMIWGAIISEIIRNGYIIIKSDIDAHYRNIFYHNFYEQYEKLDYQRFHDFEDPICEICKQQKKR